MYLVSEHLYKVLQKSNCFSNWLERVVWKFQIEVYYLSVVKHEYLIRFAIVVTFWIAADKHQFRG